MKTGIRLLNGPDDRPCLIEGTHPLTLGELRDKSEEILEAISTNRWGHIALINATVPTQIAAIHACQSHGTNLLLLRAEADVSETMPDELALSVVLDRHGTPLQSFPNAPSRGTGKLQLTTSGTSGRPKTISHSLDDLCRTITTDSNQTPSESWLLTYHPASFAGLQVIFTSLLRRSLLIVPSAFDQTSLNAAFAKHSPTHISGTPSFWRGLSMGLPDAVPNESVRQLTLGGEIADQTTLDLLNERFPTARIVHIYATTEAGVVFSVQDKQAGFPAEWLSQGIHGTRLRIQNGQLEIAHVPTGGSHAGPEAWPWISTGDLVEQRDDRVFFMGRADGVINVGGSKVAPEEVESVLLRHPDVAEVHVFGKRSPIVGAIVAAEIVLHPGTHGDQTELREGLHQFAAEHLAGHQIPRMIEFVESIPMGSTGKKQRQS